MPGPFGYFFGSPAPIEGTSSGDVNMELVMKLLNSLQDIKGPEPPTPQPPMGLGDRWISGMANALNPGQIPSARDRWMQAQKEQEDYQARVEADKARRISLLGTLIGGQLKGNATVEAAGVRANAPSQNKLRFIPQTILENGVPKRVVDIYNPMETDPTKAYLGRASAEDAGFAPYVQPAIPGVSGPTIVPRTVEPGGGAREVGKAPPPPPNIVNSLAQDKVSLEAIDNMKAAYHTLRQQTANQTFIGKAGREMIGATKYGGAFKETQPYATYASTMRNSLNAYIRAQTGAQFSVKEMDRYTALYPEAWDPEDLAATKMDNLRQRALGDMQEKLRLYPAAQEPTAPTTGGDKQVGTKNGVPVYERPDGTRYMRTPD